MAITNENHGNFETQWGWSEESTFNTAALNSAAFERLEAPVPVPNYDYRKIHDMRHNGSRIVTDQEMLTLVANAWHTVPFSDLVVRREDVGFLLYSVLQQVAEGAAGTFAKTFTIDNTTTQPSFSNDEGLFFTIGINQGIAGRDTTIRSCIGSTITLSWDTAASADPRLRASGEFVSGGYCVHTNTFSGGWDYSDDENFYDMSNFATKQLDSVDVVIFGGSLTFATGPTRVGNDAGAAEDYTLAQNGFMLTGNLILRYDANVVDMLGTHHRNGTLFPIDLEIGSAAAEGHLQFVYNAAKVISYSHDHSRAEGQSINLTFQAGYDKTGSNAAFVGTVEDGKDRAWPA